MGRMSLNGKTYSIMRIDCPRLGQKTTLGSGIITEIYGNDMLLEDGFAYYRGDEPPRRDEESPIKSKPVLVDDLAVVKVQWFDLIPEGVLLVYDEG